jgi:hypothetical protein
MKWRIWWQAGGDPMILFRDFMRVEGRSYIFGDKPDRGWAWSENWLKRVVIPIDRVRYVEEVA